MEWDSEGDVSMEDKSIKLDKLSTWVPQSWDIGFSALTKISATRIWNGSQKLRKIKE